MKKQETVVAVVKETKVDRKTIAENIEQAFKDNKMMDVVADTNLENPTGLSYEDYKFIHFYKKGTTKDLFQLYITGKTGTFYVRTVVAEHLGKDVEKTPAMKKQKDGSMKVNLFLVKAPIDTVPTVAEKILDACIENEKMVEQIKAQKDAEKAAQKEAKKAEKEAKKQATEKKETKSQPKKKAEKTAAKEKTQKKVANN